MSKRFDVWATWQVLTQDWGQPWSLRFLSSMASKSSSSLKTKFCWDCLFRFRPSRSAKSTQPSRTQDSTTKSNNVSTSTAYTTQSGRSFSENARLNRLLEARTNSSRPGKKMQNRRASIEPMLPQTWLVPMMGFAVGIAHGYNNYGK